MVQSVYLSMGSPVPENNLARSTDKTDWEAGLGYDNFSVVMNVSLSILATDLATWSFMQHESHSLKDHKYRYYQWNWLMFGEHFNTSTNTIHSILKGIPWTEHCSLSPILHRAEALISTSLLKVQ